MNISTTKGQSYHQLDQQGKLEIEAVHNLVHQTAQKKAYYEDEAQVMAMAIDTIRGIVLGQTHYSVKKGIKAFGVQGKEAVLKEIKQLHDRTCFEPILIKDLTPLERRRAMEALIFLTEKRDGSIKARQVYNGKPTREWLSREESSSPTASLESIILTSVIDCKEARDVMVIDVPNAFIQAELPTGPNIEKVCMKITGVLVDYLLAIAPDVYSNYVVFERGKRVLYVQVIKALYGMLVAALVWYKKFKADLQSMGFEFNPYDACVANRMVNGKQQTIRFHVDDLMSSHVDPQVNDMFYKELKERYGKFKEVTVKRGPVHDYLGVVYRHHPGKYLEIDMRGYIKDMIAYYPNAFKGTIKCSSPAGPDLFESKPNTGYLCKEKAELFHTMVAKGLFVAKRARPDILPVIAVLCTRVSKPTEHDWKLLDRMMKFLYATREETQKIDVNQQLNITKWYIDAAFAVHEDFKSHTGGVLFFDNIRGGSILSVSRKQKLNTKSSTEAELVAVDDVAVMIFWTRLFMEAQGYPIEKNIIFQDNQSAILLETNGKWSSGKRSRAFNIRYFFITDQCIRGNATIMYCPTDQMAGDYMTKPLQGTKGTNWRNSIMNSGYKSS